MSITGAFIWFQSVVINNAGREGIFDWKLHWYPKFYNIVTLFVGSKTLSPFIWMICSRLQIIQIKKKIYSAEELILFIINGSFFLDFLLFRVKDTFFLVYSLSIFVFTHPIHFFVWYGLHIFVGTRILYISLRSVQYLK